jgi:pimeloyl-ACP methyl ester carboxylesterase
MPEFYIRTFPGGITGWKFPVNYALRWVENSSPLEPGIRKLFFLAQIHGKAANQVFPRVFTDEELRKLKVPVLLMYGEKEVIYNYTKAIRRAESLIETIQTVIIPEANHFTAVSRPEEVNRRILEFLSEPKT